MEIAIHPNLPDLYRRKVAELQQMLEDERPARRLSTIFARLLIESKSTPAKSGATAKSFWSAPWLKSSHSASRNDHRLRRGRWYVLDGCGGRI